MNVEKIIEQIAREQNMTPGEVEEAMRYAIREAMATQDPQAQKLWKQIAPDGKEPSLDKFLGFCASWLNRERNR